MKAVQINGLRSMEVIDLPKPSPAAGEVLIRLEYVGFCGSDLNTWRGGNAMAKMPVIPGHEVGAVIEELGEGAPEFLKPGMHVTVNPCTNCGKCPSCRNGRVNACQDNQTLGVQRDGIMCEYAVLPWEKIIPAGELSTRTCALIEPMSVGFHAVARAEVSDTDYVMVIGCGMVGMGAIVRSIQRGATVIAADIDDEKLGLARKMGAAYTINTIKEDAHARLAEITSGAGPDVVIEAVGSAPTYQMAINEVGFTGRVACIGYAKSDISFTTRFFVQKELDIRGSRNAMPKDFLAVIRYLQKGNCPVDSLISKEVSPEEAPLAMYAWDIAPGKTFRILVKF